MKLTTNYWKYFKIVLNKLNQEINERLIKDAVTLKIICRYSDFNLPRVFINDTD